MKTEDLVLPLEHTGGGDIFEADGCCIARLGSRPMDAELAQLFTTALNSYADLRQQNRILMGLAMATVKAASSVQTEFEAAHELGVLRWSASEIIDKYRHMEGK